MKKGNNLIFKTLSLLTAFAIVVCSSQIATTNSLQTVNAATKKVKKIKLATNTNVKTVYIGGSSKYKSLTIKSTITPKGASKKVTYSSSKPKVATVSKKGKVKGKKVGTTKITVRSTSNTKVKKTITIKVKKYSKRVKPKSLSAKISKLTLSSGRTAKIKATLKPSTTTNKAIKYKSYNKSLATVSKKGIVTANKNGKAGTVKIRVYAGDKNKKGKTIYKDFKVTIKPVSASKITVSSTRVIYTSANSRLTTTFSPINTTNKNVIYTTSNASVVSVDKNGSMTGKTAGIATVTARSSNGKTAICKVTVNNRRQSIHDPSITVAEDGKYYLFGTHLGVAKSTDLMSWDSIGGTQKLFNTTSTGFVNKLSNIYSWINSSGTKNESYTWAPSVIYNKTKKKYYYYACTSAFGTTNSVIWFATADNIEGPYSAATPIIYSGFNNSTSGSYSYTRTNIKSLIDNGTLSGLGNWFSNGNYNSSPGKMPNAIDPAMFYDQYGKMWMTYGSFSGGIYILEIDTKTGMPKYPGKDDTANGIDRYYGKMLTTSRMSDSNSNGNGEGPYSMYDPTSGYYYLFNTYGGLAALDGYNTRVFRSKNPDGPYEDAAGTLGTSTANKGLKLMGNYKLPTTDSYLSPGHSSEFVDRDGKMYHIYHTRFNDGVGDGHQVRTHQMFVNSQGWTVTLPYEYNGETISKNGYTTNEVVGMYSFINHGNTTPKTSSFNNVDDIMQKVQTISLNANGTINGDLTGTWTFEGTNSANVKLSIGAADYYGSFCYQSDESDNKTRTMVFAAAGSNNCTIWGSKTSLTNAVTVSKTIEQLTNDLSTSVRTNLPTTGLGGASISWSSNNTTIISNTGTVTRPNVDTKVTVTATVKYGTTTQNKTFAVTVKGLPNTIVNNDGIIAKYTFDNSNNLGLDSSGNTGLNATTNSTTYTASQGNRSGVLYFNGTNTNYVKLPSAVSNTENFTFSAWVYSTSTDWWQRIVDLGNG